MDWRKLTLVVCVSSLTMALSASAPVVSVVTPCTSPDCNTPQSKQIYQQAEAITVKVVSTDFLGSGILLRKQGSVYTVLTNAHVLQAGDAPYRVQTPDGQIHAANLPKGVNFGKNDLALLQFQSSSNIYNVASLGKSPAVGDEVFAVGFPATEEGTQAKGFVLTTGKVLLVLPKPLEGGYQLGYTNNLEKGMSGGPLLNRRGEVVGVSGMQAYPLWDAPSVFQDGIEVDEPLHKTIIRLSWAVPIKTH
jgi:S1-C subfamily serine protease